MSPHEGGDGGCVGGGGDGGGHTAGQLVALHARITAGVPPCWWHWTQHGQMTSALPQSAGGGGEGVGGGGEGEGGGGLGGGGGDGGAGQYSQVPRQTSL